MYYFSIYIIGWLMRVHLHEHQHVHICIWLHMHIWMLNDTSGAKRLHSLNMSASCRVRLWDNWDEHQLMRSERGTGAHAPEESLHGHANLLPYVGKVTEVNPKLANPHTIWILLTGWWLSLPLWKIWKYYSQYMKKCSKPPTSWPQDVWRNLRW